MKKIFLGFLTFIYILNGTVSVFAETSLENKMAVQTEKTKAAADALNLDAYAAILMDAKTGEILYAKDIESKQYPASITKLMTVLLCFENSQMDEVVTYSHNAVYSIEFNSSNIGLRENEQITMEQSLYGIMLQSANEGANGVAEHIDGTTEAFAQHMTERAKELGAVNTNFLNPHGLHDVNHYTCAYDMALIAKELLKFPKFKEIMGTLYYEIPPTNECDETRYIYAQNQLIKSSSKFYYEDSEGGKTGFTDEARNTLVAYAKRGDTELISVVLHSTGYGEYTDTIALFDYGFDNYETRLVDTGGNVQGTVNVVKVGTHDVTGTTNVVIKNDIYATTPLEYHNDKIEAVLTAKPTVEDHVETNEALGIVEYSLKGQPVATGDAVSEASFQAGNEALGEDEADHKLIIGAGILAGLVFIVWLIRSFSRDKERQRRKRRRRQSQVAYREKQAPKEKTAYREKAVRAERAGRIENNK